MKSKKQKTLEWNLEFCEKNNMDCRGAYNDLMDFLERKEKRDNNKKNKGKIK